MSDTAEMGRKREGPPGRRPLADDELADQLLGKAQAEGVETGDTRDDGARGGRAHSLLVARA